MKPAGTQLLLLADLPPAGHFRTNNGSRSSSSSNANHSSSGQRPEPQAPATQSPAAAGAPEQQRKDDDPAKAAPAAASGGGGGVRARLKDAALSAAGCFAGIGVLAEIHYDLLDGSPCVRLLAPLSLLHEFVQLTIAVLNEWL